MRVPQHDEERKTLSRGERVRLADLLRGKDAIAGLRLPEVRRAITQAPRGRLTRETERAPRQYRLGAGVAALCERLLFWEGRGADREGRVHKSFAELERETGLTRRQLQTARKVGEAEGLFVAEAGFRPDFSRQRTLFWTLNLWRLHEVVIASTMEEVEAKLECETRKRKRDELNVKYKALKRALDDLRLVFLKDDPEEEQDGEDHTAAQGGVMTSCCDRDSRLSGLQGSTQGISYVDKDSLRSSLSTPGAEAPQDQSARDMTAKTISRTRELGFEASKSQRDAWGAGWRHFLSDDNPLDTEQVARVLAKIVSAAAGALSQSGAGFFLSVVDAERRVRGVNVPNSRQLKKLKGRRGSEKFDVEGDADEEAQGEERFDNDDGVGDEARQEPPGRPQQEPKPEPAPAPPKKEPAPEPEPVPSLSMPQVGCLSDMMRGKDGENALSLLAIDHLEGRVDGEGEPVTLERIAEVARQEIAPDFPLESFMGPVRRDLVSQRAMREFQLEQERR